jgi:hypothetical protein
MTPSTPTDTTGPAQGDVLIARDTTHTKAYALSVVPGPPQMHCPTYEDAMSTAVAWASQRRVAIWFTQDGQTATPVSPARGPAATQRVNKPRDTA